MVKNNPQRRKKRKPFDSTATPSSDDSSTTNQPKLNAFSNGRWPLIVIFLVIAVGGTYLANALRASKPVPIYSYKVIKEFKHDPTAFTQGLLFEKGVLWESTGKRGESTIRKVDLETGNVIDVKKLADNQFGEGLAMVGDKLYQLTYTKGICHVYDLEFNKLKEFKYSSQGWGLTYDGEHLIMSDGTSRLRFLDPETFKESKPSVRVLKGRLPIDRINELEYVGGYVWANRFEFDSIYKIDPETGQVEGILDLRGLFDSQSRESVLNGIAVDSVGPNQQRVFVTGKYWPKLFQIELVEEGMRR